MLTITRLIRSGLTDEKRITLSLRHLHYAPWYHDREMKREGGRSEFPREMRVRDGNVLITADALIMSVFSPSSKGNDSAEYTTSTVLFPLDEYT